MNKPPATKKKRSEAKPSRGPERTVAVIDIGASSIRMAVAEIHEDGKIRTLDSLIQPVELGRDAFNHRSLGRASIEKAVNVLRKYRRVLREYNIRRTDDVRVVATSAVREATNRLAFIDRVYMATGLHVEVMDEAEVNRIMYMGVMPHVRADQRLAEGKIVVFEIGGGSTELLVIRGGNVLHSESYRLGSLRLLEQIRLSRGGAMSRRELLENYIQRILDRVVDQVRADVPLQMVALGGDIRFAGHCLLDAWDGVSLTRLPVDRLASFAETVMAMTDEQIVKRYGASFLEAQTLPPTILMYKLLAEHFGLDRICLCDANLRDGLLRDIASGGDWTAEFRDQTIRSAKTLGRRYDFDEGYAVSVAELSRRLFFQWADEHELSSRYEVILYVAALLHEIGLFINVRSNHKHAFYIIRNSELFGLSRNDRALVGLIARYHRRAFPQPQHEYYRSLDRDSRVTVAKLASILRVAIALDDTRSGRIREVQCARDGKRMVINVPDVDDVSLERFALQRAGGLFEEVFGMSIMLRAGGARG